MHKIYTYLYLLLLFTCFSCLPHLDFPPLKDDFSINMILRSNTKTQMLSLKRVRAFNSNTWISIKNASVFITNEAGIMWQGVFVPEKNKYFFSNLNPIPGNTYLLSVELDDQKKINAKTTVPSKPLLKVSERNLSWTPKKSRLWKVGVIGKDTVVDFFKNINIKTFYQWDAAVTTPFITIPSNLQYSSSNAESKSQVYTFLSTKYYTIRLEAYDKNMTSFTLESSSRAGLDQEYGVFGSVTVLDTVIRFLD